MGLAPNNQQVGLGPNNEAVNDPHFALVTGLEQILENLRYLEGIRCGDPNSPHWGWYRDRIEQGICFLPYQTGPALAFAPSRFIGYAGNTFEVHNARALNGTLTNQAISRVLGAQLTPAWQAQGLEHSFRTFCRDLDVTPAPAFGAKRRYWSAIELPQ